jgi:hypothetical protein
MSVPPSPQKEQLSPARNFPSLAGRWRNERAAPVAALPPRRVESFYPVDADMMSVLPKVGGQSVSGQGAPGRARCPAANESDRYF